MTSENVTNNARARERKSRITISDEIVSEILERIADGESLNKICSVDGMPSRKSFYEWVSQDADLQRRYELALEMRASLYFDEIIEIADDAVADTYTDNEGVERTNQEVVARSKLRVDARKWAASKLLPKKYGERLDVTAQNTNHNINQDAGEIDMTKLSGSELEALTSLLKKAAK